MDWRSPGSPRIAARAERSATPLIAGLTGDRFSGGKKAKRQITLIQQEHLIAIASILQHDAIDPQLVRRNIVVSGINLQVVEGPTFQNWRCGPVFGTGNCPPCSRMEENFGTGRILCDARPRRYHRVCRLSRASIRLKDSVALP